MEEFRFPFGFTIAVKMKIVCFAQKNPPLNQKFKGGEVFRGKALLECRRISTAREIIFFHFFHERFDGSDFFFGLIDVFYIIGALQMLYPLIFIDL